MISLRHVCKTYISGLVKTEALRDVTLDIQEGQFVVILGPSGSGKSTLLNVISGLDQVTSGEITFKEQLLTSLRESEMTEFRRRYLGFIFQQYNLLQNLTVFENVQIGTDISSDPRNVLTVLKEVGLEDLKDKYPYQLSGGEQQRVSVARSLAKNPEIIFCDEPTGSLDEKNAKQILTILQELNRKYQKTIVLITHNTGIAAMADIVIRMNSGQISQIKTNRFKLRANDINWG